MTSNPKPNYKVCIEDKKVCRSQQIAYCEQIYNEYIKKQQNEQMIRRMFETLHSDWLNIEETTVVHNNESIPILKSKTKFDEGDILLEIRGSIINRNKLNMLVRENIQVKNMMTSLNCLVWGQNDVQVLVPKGLSKILMNNRPNYMSFVTNNQKDKNCFIEYELGAKYLISASKPIKQGQTLILDVQSLRRVQYKHQSL